jgi:NTE family protein
MKAPGRPGGRFPSEELHMTANGLKVGLALSAGTARTIAHVGVLKALEEEGITVDLLAGTSGGSLIGALYAGGVGVQRLEEIACRARWRDFAGLVIPRMGFLSSEGIARFLIRHIGDPDFSELMLPLGVVTADLLSGEKVVITEGRVADAVRASCSLPQIYAPVEHEGRVLVDGGLVESLPVETAREMGADVVIAVSARGRGAAPSRPRNVVQVVFLVIGHIGAWNAIASEAQADVVIHPEVSGSGLFSLEAGASLIAAGYDAARRAMPFLKQQLDQAGAGVPGHPREPRRAGLQFDGGWPDTVPAE